MKTLQKLSEKLNSPTPRKFRNIGKAIGALGTTIQVAVAGMQVGSDLMSPIQYFWFVIGLAILQWAGTTITDFATGDESLKPKPNE